MRHRHRKLLTFCIAVSVLIHIGAVLSIQRHSLWFSSQSPKIASSDASYLSLIDKKERDQILRETFEESFSPPAEGTQIVKPQPESLCHPLFHASKPTAESSPSDLSILFQQNFPFPAEELLAFHSLPTFTFPMENRLDLFQHISKDLVLPTPSHPILPSLHPAPLPSFPPTIQSKPIEIKHEEAPFSEIAYIEPLLNSFPLKETLDLPKKTSLPALTSNLPHLPTLADLETTSYSDVFDAELVFLPNEEGEGYIFALTLIPRPDLDLPKLRQHYTFLIDRSNSIQRDRLTAVKNAVHKVLEDLSSEDTFNIIAFDSKMEKFSPHSLSPTAQSLAAAEEFLEKINLGSFFSQSNLYRPLFLTVPGGFSEDEVHSAILFTDSENLGKKTEQNALLSDWTRYNQGKVALFSIGVKGDRHLGTLDAASAFNRGKLSYSLTKRGLKRKLLKLMKTIQNPIAKNLATNAVSRSPKTKIELFPKSAAHLYLDHPYVILGTTNSLDDFILFVQGRIKGRWLNIKKKISFLHAKKGNPSLKAEWALQRSYSFYEQYVLDENPAHLAKARALLEPYDFQAAFE